MLDAILYLFYYIFADILIPEYTIMLIKKYWTVFDVGYSHNRVRAIQTHTANHGELDICPVQTLIEVVHCKTFFREETLTHGFHLNIVNKCHVYRKIKAAILLVRPVGHWMFSWTRVCLRVPSMAAVSIFGWLPQSVQYMVLRYETKIAMKKI